MSTIPGDFPEIAPTAASDAVEDGMLEKPRFEFPWQDLSFASHYVNDRRWKQSQLPAILEVLPEHTTVDEQIRNILRWSLCRFEVQPHIEEQPSITVSSTDSSEAVPVIVEDAERSIGELTLLVPKTDGSEVPTASSGIRAGKDNPILSRLRQLRQDISLKRADKSRLVADSSNYTAATLVKQIPQTGECISCFDEILKAGLVLLTCSHDYCKPCLREVVSNAMKTESAFPPKCCLTEIPLKTALSCLSSEQRDEYKEKSAEYSIPAGHRWYCPEPKCGKWIKPEKLQRSRKAHQTCPHCKIKICSHCRAIGHDANQDCPQDFGLESTLEIAESEGWRRCYSCRTMVELTIGCRHITCRCGAQFCYVCNAKWKTCECSEADKETRMQELRVRRRQRDQQQQEEDEVAQAEAEEIAEALAQIEELERQEALRLAEEERQRVLEEELLLAQLEEARLLEEIAKREHEEEVERQFRQTLLESSKEQCQTLMATLMQIINFQHAALVSQHEASEHACVEKRVSSQAALLEECAQWDSWLERNISRRTRALHHKQREAWEQLLRAAECEEDDMFMQMHMYLRGKPNREQREKQMRDKFHIQQQERQETMQKKHDAERQRLEVCTHCELEGIGQAKSVMLEPLETQYEVSLIVLGNQVGRERRWFQLVSQRRIEMMREHKRLVIEQLQTEQDPAGLREEQAQAVQPYLPAIDDVEPGIDTDLSVDPDSTTASAQSLQAINETDDLYSSTSQTPSSDLLAPSDHLSRQTTCYSRALNATSNHNHLSRSDTVIRPVPGSFPASTTLSASESRNTYPSSAQTQTRLYNNNSAENLASMSTIAPTTSTGLPTQNVPVSMPRKPVPPRSSIQGSGDAVMPDATPTHTRDSSSTASTSFTARSADTRRTSSRTSASTTADNEVLDTIPANVLVSATSAQADRNTMKKGKWGFSGRFTQEKTSQMSQDEIRRRMNERVYWR